MGLFENLFKPRPDGTLERIVEAPLKASGLAERAAAVEGEAAPDPATAFLQPKGYAPGATSGGVGAQNQGFVPVLPSSKRTHPPERKTPAPEGPIDEGSMVVLTVGDVLPRIPVAFLRPGAQNLKRELRFHIEDLASDITRGRPSIALSCIAEQAPELFHSPIGDAEDMAIRLPLQKLVEQIGRLRAHGPTAPAPSVAHAPHRPLVAAPVEKPRLEVPAPVRPSAPTPAPPVVENRAEPAPAPPVAPKIAAPVAPPPPAQLAPLVAPIMEIPPTPAPEPAVVAPVAPEPPRAQPPEPPPEPPAALPAVIREAPPSVPAPAPEPMRPPAPEPMRSREMAPAGSVIDLSLAAIVAKVPREMVAEPLPRIGESERISLPFPMIEKQLGTGTVEISAKLFWSALPPLLKHYFIAREGLNVPLPLEEIFQNLPVGGAEKPRFEADARAASFAPFREAPIVLAPPPHDDATPELSFDAPPAPEAPLVAAAPAPAVVEEPAPVIAAELPPAPALPTIVEEAKPVTVAEIPLPPAVAVSAPEPAPAAAPEEFVLTASAPAEVVEPSAVSAAPAAEQPALVHLQPFRIFNPPTPTVEPEPEPAAPEALILGEAPTATAGDTSSQILHLDPKAQPADEEEATPPGAKAAAEPEAMPPPAPTPPAAESPEEPAPKFSVLPAPVAEPEPFLPPAPSLPEPEPLVAFNPDLPPPLKVAEPAAAVAVLRATVPVPQEMPAVAMAAGNIQPPRIFRPVVMPPPISSLAAVAPVNLAPTLSGPGSIAGMISLSPAAEIRSPAHFAPTAPPVDPTPPPMPLPVPVAEAPPEPSPIVPVEAPAAPAPEVRDEPAPSLKNLVRRLFTAPPAAEETTPEPPSATETIVAPPPATPAPKAARTEPAAPAVDSAPPPAAPLQLPLPPLPPPAVATPLLPVENAPPALPISRFDQHSLQSLFMTDETLDLPKVSRLAATLPGIQGCVIVSRGETFSSGIIPEGFHLNALRGLAPQVGAAADRLPIGELKNFTLYGEQYSISFFERPAVCLCAVHRARSFVPGVREKLVAVVDELARG